MKAKSNNSFSPALESTGWLIFRAGTAGFMLSHGWPKLQRLFEGGTVEFADPFGIGELPTLVLTVFAEFLCAVLVLIGWKSRWAAIPLIITFLVIIFQIHGSDPITDRELPFLYLFSFIAILVKGSGAYSVDGLLASRRK